MGECRLGKLIILVSSGTELKALTTRAYLLHKQSMDVFCSHSKKAKNLEKKQREKKKKKLLLHFLMLSALQSKCSLRVRGNNFKNHGTCPIPAFSLIHFYWNSLNLSSTLSQVPGVVRGYFAATEACSTTMIDTTKVHKSVQNQAHKEIKGIASWALLSQVLLKYL